ncbi:MAG: S-formylglutathione hydrolase [Cellvibrionaceae bacterium]
MGLEMMNEISSNKMFGGDHKRFTHQSKSCCCEMTFAIYLPPQLSNTSSDSQYQKLPVLYWLSGLTCNDENFSTKAGAQRYAAEHGIVLVMPDTSPRGVNIEGEDDSYDFGSAAGFYLNATEKPWSDHYNMYDYVVKELPDLIEGHFPVDPRRKSISGHSMGGHGALTIALKNPEVYRSVSAFAPIVAPTQVPWGQKIFAGYLGRNENDWKAYDSVCLIESGNRVDDILVTQGKADDFLKEQLKPELLEAACKEKNIPIQLNIVDGYDHSYFFIASFIEEHIHYHAKYLNA